MNKQLFKNVACFTDIHFGLKNNSRQHNDDCEAFVKWFIEEAKSRGCETCIFLGDWHHHRSNVNVSTLNYTMSNLSYLNDAFETVYVITGNHDLFYREKREIHSLVMGKNYENVVLVDEPLIEGDVAIVPWLIDDEWKKVRNIKTKYVFGHFEIPGFKMNALVDMPDHGGGINSRHFKDQDYVFSGHFHKRQAGTGHIHYIGNPFGHNYADAWEFDRGAMFLKWDGKPEYVNWEDGPRYITCYLSDLLENTEEYLSSGVYARVTLDCDITYEEANFLRETFIENYDIREFKLIYDRSEEEEHQFEGEITFQTIDQIVNEGLMGMDTNSFDLQMLTKIYNDL